MKKMDVQYNISEMTYAVFGLVLKLPFSRPNAFLPAIL